MIGKQVLARQGRLEQKSGGGEGPCRAREVAPSRRRRGWLCSAYPCTAICAQRSVACRLRRLVRESVSRRAGENSAKALSPGQPAVLFFVGKRE